MLLHRLFYLILTTLQGKCDGIECQKSYYKISKIIQLAKSRTRIQTWVSMGPMSMLLLLYHHISFQSKKEINGSSMHGRETLREVVTYNRGSGKGSHWVLTICSKSSSINSITAAGTQREQESQQPYLLRFLMQLLQRAGETFKTWTSRCIWFHPLTEAHFDEVGIKFTNVRN